MLPEAAEAIRIADQHLAGESIVKRKALAMDIMAAISRYAGIIAAAAVKTALETPTKPTH